MTTLREAAHASDVLAAHERLDTDDILQLYKYLQQANHGDCDARQPSWLNAAGALERHAKARKGKGGPEDEKGGDGKRTEGGEWAGASAAGGAERDAPKLEQRVVGGGGGARRGAGERAWGLVGDGAGLSEEGVPTCARRASEEADPDPESGPKEVRSPARKLKRTHGVCPRRPAVPRSC